MAIILRLSKKCDIFRWRCLASGLFLCFLVCTPTSIYAQLPAKKPLGKKSELPAKKPLGTNSGTPANNDNRDYSNWVDNIGRSVERGRHRYDPAYSNLTLQTGLSRVHGEFIRAKACLGGQTGYVLYGGVGRDWLFNAKNEKFIGPDAKKLGWHAGLGYYGGDLNGETATGEFALLMDYAETPMVDNGSLNLWLEGTWYFGADGHFGAFGGLGVSGGNLKNEKLTWNFIFEIGLAYRFY